MSVMFGPQSRMHSDQHRGAAAISAGATQRSAPGVILMPGLAQSIVDQARIRDPHRLGMRNIGGRWSSPGRPPDAASAATQSRTTRRMSETSEEASPLLRNVASAATACCGRRGAPQYPGSPRSAAQRRSMKLPFLVLQMAGVAAYVDM